MNRYIIAPSASQDLNKIADYFLVVNIEAGEKLFRKFYKNVIMMSKRLKQALFTLMRLIRLPVNLKIHRLRVMSRVKAYNKHY